jgi:ATP-binding cassette subfamily B protein
MHSKGKRSTVGSVKRIMLQSRRFWPHLGLLFLLSILAAPVALLKPFALKLLIDSGFGTQPVPRAISFFFPSGFNFSFGSVVIIATVFVIIVALIDNVIIFISWLLSTSTGEKLVLNFRKILFDHIQRLSLAYHDTKGTSDSLYRIQWDAMSVRSLLLTQIPPLLTSIITLLSMVVVMFLINWRFAVITLCIIPPLIILTRISNKKLIRHWYKVKDDESVAMSVIHEVLSSLRIVKAFGQEENENERFIDRSNTAVKGQIRLARTAAGFSFLIGMLLAAGTALFIYIGAMFVRSGEMTLGDLTVIIAYLSQVIGPLQSIVKTSNDIQSSVASIDRVFDVLDESREVKESANAVHIPRVAGSFAFENVSFSYVENKPTLQDISFNINAGDRVGIMGTTGAGKSTLISLLMRFYDPTEGVIKIDGADIKNYKLADYRNQFSIVLQDPVLFSTSIRENIKYGKPGATEEEIVNAAIAANAHGFIIKNKEGYDAETGERGMQLSGGERQRISIARAFIKNAPVLILDEPTSSLDIRTESLIMEAMERLMEGRTTFMITHRLDTLNSCNLILHLEKGKLIEVVRDHDVDFLARKKTAFLKQAEK